MRREVTVVFCLLGFSSLGGGVSPSFSGLLGQVACLESRVADWLTAFVGSTAFGRVALRWLSLGVGSGVQPRPASSRGTLRVFLFGRKCQGNRFPRASLQETTFVFSPVSVLRVSGH